MSVARETEDIARDLVRHHHDHPPVRDLNREEDRRADLASRTAGDAARVVGTWAFVGAQALVALVWIVLNAAGVHTWDAYPFRLLNLIVGIEVLLAVAITLMALNRAYVRERLRAQQAFEQEVKLEEELKSLMTHLERQDDMILEVLQRLDRSERDLLRIQRQLAGGS
ncbi:MAG TPA: DUF1003 domain-containing protein [Candidatus Dormibacteraeota bacterium]